MRKNASFLLRCKAFLIDYILIVAYLISLAAVSLFLLPSVQGWFAGSLVTAQLAGFATVTLPVSAYFVVSDSAGRQSFGKKRAGIRVVGENGERPSVSRIIFRTALKFLPWELSHFLVYRLANLGDTVPLYCYWIGGLVYGLIIAYAATAIFTRKKRSLYDLLAGTQVIRV